MKTQLPGLAIWLLLFGVATWPHVSGNQRGLIFAGWLLAATAVYFLGLAIFRNHSVHR